MRVGDGAAGEERVISLVFGVWRCFVDYLIPNAKRQRQTREAQHQTPNTKFVFP